MKSHDQQLHEWLTDEIAFDLGGAKSMFTKEEFVRIADAFSQGRFANLKLDANIPEDNVSVCMLSWYFFNGKRPHPVISAQWLLQFSDVRELMFVLMNLPASSPESTPGLFSG